jgi:EmrB/QacA subfamily drug resistance transporter
MSSSNPHAPARSRTATLVVACLGVLIAYLPVTTVSVSLPAIQRALGATTAELSWVSSAFVLPMAALILTAGVFGDVHGRKKVLLVGLGLSGLGALVSLTAGAVQQVWIGQAVSGLGAAALLPTTLALISHAVPDHKERGRFIGIWATSMLLSMAIGPLVAGTLLQHVGWRWIFVLPIPASLVVLAVAARALPESRAPHARSLDWAGQVSAALTITAAVFAVIQGGASSFTDVPVLVAIAVALVAGVTFVVVERRSASPMLDLRLFRSPAFTATTVVAVVSFLGLIGFFFVLSLYFGSVQQLDTLHAALRLLVSTGASIVVGAVVGAQMHRMSARWLISGGLVVVGGTMLSLTTLEADTSFLSVAWRMALLGVGLGTVFTPMTATAVSSVPHHLAGMAAAGNNAFRQVGGALGPAVLGALLSTRAASTFGGHLTDAGVPVAEQQPLLAVADGGGLAGIARMDLGEHTGAVLGALGESMLDGLRLSLTVAAALALLAALLCAVLLRKPAATTPATTVPTAAAGDAAPAPVGAGA